MRAYERLVRYAKVETTGQDGLDIVPSSPGQLELARLLAQEMRELGMTEVYVDQHAYAYGKVAATPGLEHCPGVGFIAHLDTVPYGQGPAKPQVIRNYAGGAIPLGSSGRILDPEQFPKLQTLQGKTLVTTDGTTVLGADDKAGIAEIMTMCEKLLHSHIPHGPVSVCFTPDEEINHGAALLDLERFGAAAAFTLDTCAPEDFLYETFHAAMAIYEITGVATHTGTAKGIMVNAALVAAEIVSCLPAEETPSRTEGYEGFYHLHEISGTVEKASLQYLIRDFDAAGFARRKQVLEGICETVNKEYGSGTVTLCFREQYRNMAEVLEHHKDVLEVARAAIRDAGLEPVRRPMRGGTDGAQLSFRGLPCPNLGVGAYSFHGPYEFAVAEEMDSVVDILTAIVKRFPEQVHGGKRSH